MKIPKTIGKAKLDKKRNCYVHIGCGGDIMFDGTGTKKLPMGIGGIIRNDIPQLMVNYQVSKGITGGCLKCRKDGFFILTVKIRTILRRYKKK